MKTDVNWRVYADTYDMINSYNPAYSEMLGLVADSATEFIGNTTSRVLDLGCGTGNLALTLTQKCQNMSITLVDSTPAMLAIAREKLDASMTTARIEYRVLDVNQEDLEDTYDVIICTHVVYALENPLQTIRQIYSHLVPGGVLLIVDLGRTLDISEWSSFLWKSIRRTHSLTTAARAFWKGRSIRRQNIAISKKQQCGEFWVHTPEQFRYAIESAEFSVQRQEVCFRGYSDFIVALRGD